MNPMINMTTHLLMLIFSRSCVKKNNNNRKDTVLLERPINQTFSVGPGGGGGGGTWVNFCWVYATGLLEPLSHYSLLYGHL